MDAHRYPDLRPFFAEQRRKDIEMSCESLEADISRLRGAQMSGWSQIFDNYQSLNHSLEGVKDIWGGNRMFLDDRGELARHVRDIESTILDMKDLLLHLCEKEIRGLDIAKDRVKVICKKAGKDYVALPDDYTDWLSSIQEICKPAYSTWDDPPPTWHEVKTFNGKKIV